MASGWKTFTDPPTGAALAPVARVASATRWRWVLLAAAVAVVGCGQVPAASPGSETTTADPAGGAVTDDVFYRDWEFPVCSDVPDLAAPPEAYRDEPIYVFDRPVAEVEAWAESQPGYEDIWTSDRLGWIAVAFSRDAEARQRDLEEKFPDVGVVAVPVERTKAELEALAFRLQRELAPLLAEYDMIGVGGSVIQGVAYLHVGVLTEELRREIERRFSGEPLCVSARDPAKLPAPGPQPDEGEGWRLLADQDGGAGQERVGLAASAAGLDELRARTGLDAPVPEVDFGDHVVIWFGVTYSGSCPDIRLDDVVVDGAVVYPEIVNLNTELDCTADANPHTYVVALKRSRLPSGPFAIQLEAETPSYAKPEQRLLVDADLSQPGAVPEPGAVRPDASLSEPTPDESGLTAQPEISHLYRLDTRCGIEWLGEVNGVAWRTDEKMPDEWQNAVEASGGLNVSITMHIEPKTVIKTELNGKTVVYKPTAEEIPDCDRP